MKKLLFTILTIMSLVMLFFAFGTTASAETYGDLTYFVSDGKVTITDCDKSVAEIIIPSEIDNYPVTSIGVNAFSGCTELTCITISASVKEMNLVNPFSSCIRLTKIIVDENNEYYSSDEHGVFFNKNKSRLIAYPAGNTRTEYIIPDSVVSIAQSSFANCTELKNIIISNSVTSVNNAFRGCSGITSITIPDSVTSFFESFSGCTSLKEIMVDENNENFSSDEYGVLFNKDKSELINYPTGITRTEYIIPESVKSLGSYAFQECAGLAKIFVDENNEYYSSDENGVLFNKDKSKLIRYPEGNTETEYIVPDSVISIGRFAFENCTGLTSITIPDSVTSIEDGTFRDCTSLESITLPFIGTRDSGAYSEESVFGAIFGYKERYNLTNIKDAVYQMSVYRMGMGMFCYYYYNIPSSLRTVVITKDTGLPDSAFKNCSMLTSVTLPDSLTSIPLDVFSGCTGLTSIKIPDSVKNIDRDAFKDCTNLKNVYATSQEDWLEIEFVNSTANPMCYAENLYFDNKLVTSVILNDSVTSIGDYTFSGCTGITNITIPDSVISIGLGAFEGCTGLTDIRVPESVMKIESSTFKDCSGLKYIEIYELIDSIESEAFMNCTSLEKIYIPATVRSVGDKAFEGCSALKDVYYGESLALWRTLQADVQFATVHYNHKHSYELNSNATCTQSGIGNYFCECGRNYTEEVSAKGHTPGAWVVKTPAKVGVKGLEVQKCTICNAEVNKRDIPALAEVVTNKVGDANGDGKITAADARITLRISAKLEKIDNYNISLAVLDATGDNKLTAADARKILRVSAKLESM